MVSRQSRDLTEVEIEGQHDSIFGKRFGEDVDVRGSVEAFVAKMNGGVERRM